MYNENHRHLLLQNAYCDPFTTADKDIVIPEWGISIDYDDVDHNTQRRILDLVESMTDHALFLAAITHDIARWELFSSFRQHQTETRLVIRTSLAEHQVYTNCVGEVCVDGLRYATSMDEFGCPYIAPNIKVALVKALEKIKFFDK